MIHVEHLKDFPVLAHNIGLAFLTVLISIAVALFNRKEEYEELDKHVILDYITQSKDIVAYIIMIFVPLLFWGDSNLVFRIFEIFFWLIGINFICQILYKSYLWMKGNKFLLRFKYLKSLTDTKETEEVWKSVWATEKINTPNEKEFFDIFSAKVDELL